jgi:arabinofuranosyltransferase
MKAFPVKEFFARNFPTVGLIAILLAHAAFIYAPCDDAYIYLVYVKSFLEGKGLTYNGEAVQGFSSILWPWLIVAIGVFKVELPRAMEMLSIFSAILVLASSYSIGVRLGLTRVQAAIPGMALVLTGDFAFYAGNGLETLLFTGMMLIVVSYLFHPESKRALSEKGLLLALFILALVRPEGMLVAIIVIGWLAYDSKNPVSGMALFSKLLLILFPVYLTLKIVYGDWLPATFYAKSGAGLANLDQGLAYTTNFVKCYLPVFLLLILAFMFRRNRIGEAALPIALLLLAWIAQVTVQGGDNMVGFRMYLPILPVMYLVIAYAFRDVPARLFSSVAIVVAAYLFWTYNFGSVMSSTWKIPLHQHANIWRNGYNKNKAVGLWLKGTFKPDTKVALSAAGITPYFSRLPTIDMLGLNNRQIALHGRKDRSLPYGHQAGDGDYVLSSNPGVIFLGAGLKPGRLLSDREIWQDPRFKRDYVPCQGPESIVAWVKKELIAETRMAGIGLFCINQ